MTVKRCGRCGATKDQSEFSRDAHKPDGLMNRCKVCDQARNRDAYDRTHASAAPSRSYRAIHKRVQRARGAAGDHWCVTCGYAADEWSYDHNDPDEIEAVTARGRACKISLDVQRYEPRCAACHVRFDAGKPRNPRLPQEGK